MEGIAFLDFAKKLLPMRIEPALRSAVSRGYYAVYNCAVQLFFDLGLRVDQSAQNHEKIYFDFNNSGIEEIKEMADLFIYLRRRRNDADYNMITSEFIDHRKSEADLWQAQYIISVLERYAKEPLRTQLKNGILEYHRKIGS